jgi:hypothetical protein
MVRVRDYQKRRDIVKAVQDARDTIIACWSEWDGEASQDAQSAQNNEAWFDCMNAQLDCVLYGMLDQISTL